jgi:hypothetical protein
MSAPDICEQKIWIFISLILYTSWGNSNQCEKTLRMGKYVGSATLQRDFIVISIWGILCENQRDVIVAYSVPY